MGNLTFNTSGHTALVDTGVYGIIMPNDIWHEYFSRIPGSVIDSNGWQYTFPCNASDSFELTVSLAGMEFPVAREDIVQAHSGSQCSSTLIGSDILANDNMKK
jgi:hypothetical protein